MAFPDVFDKQVADSLAQRINKLTPESKPLWGKMDVAQMLAHCCVTYELVYENKYRQPNAFVKFLLKTLAKNMVVNERPYKHNMGTGPQFHIKGPRNFEIEKKRLIDYVHKTQQLGGNYFKDKESHSFGPLTLTEWNNMFYKHLDHHLQQFGV